MYFNSDPAARGTGKTTGFISHGKISTIVSHISAPQRHHPTLALENVQFGVSNDPGGLPGPEISQVEGGPSWSSGLPGEGAKGRAAHHVASSCIGSSRYKTGP